MALFINIKMSPWGFLDLKKKQQCQNIIHAASVRIKSLYVEFGLQSLHQTEARMLSAHKEPLSEEQPLLDKTLQPTIFIPVVGKQTWRFRDSHAEALIQLLFLFWLSCPLMMLNVISLLIKRTSAAGPATRR